MKFWAAEDSPSAFIIKVCILGGIPDTWGFKLPSFSLLGAGHVEHAEFTSEPGCWLKAVTSEDSLYSNRRRPYLPQRRQLRGDAKFDLMPILANLNFDFHR